MRGGTASSVGGVSAGGLPNNALNAHGKKTSDPQGQVPARHREMQGRGSIFLGKARICFILAV